MEKQINMTKKQKQEYYILAELQDDYTLEEFLDFEVIVAIETVFKTAYVYFDNGSITEQYKECREKYF